MAGAAPAAVLVGELSGLLARLAGADPRELSDPALVEGLDGLLEAERVLRAVQTRWLAVADAREATVGVCGRATRSFLVEEHQLGANDAGARVKLARTLAAVPAVDAAFSAGQVTAEQASVMVAACLDVPVQVRDTVAGELVKLAASTPPFHLARAVEAILARLGVDEDAAQARLERRLARRHVDVDATFDGVGHLSGSLTPDVYEAVRLALDAAGCAPAGVEDDRTAAQRRHDALGELARFYLDNADTLPAVNAERPRIVVTTTMKSLTTPDPGTAVPTGRSTDPTAAAGHGPAGAGDDGWGRLDSGVPVPPATLRRLACDATLLPVLLDGGTATVLDLGRTTRTFSTAIRRAAWIRDQARCTFPRCRRRPTDLHHIIWWSHGGPTSLDNATWLCTFHHWLVHEAGWRMHRDHTHHCVFTAPDGRQFTHPPHTTAA